MPFVHHGYEIPQGPGQLRPILLLNVLPLTLVPDENRSDSDIQLPHGSAGVPLLYLAACRALVRGTPNFVNGRRFRSCHDPRPAITAHCVRAAGYLGANWPPLGSATLITVPVNCLTK